MFKESASRREDSQLVKYNMDLNYTHSTDPNSSKKYNLRVLLEPNSMLQYHDCPSQDDNNGGQIECGSTRNRSLEEMGPDSKPSDLLIQQVDAQDEVEDACLKE